MLHSIHKPLLPGTTAFIVLLAPQLPYIPLLLECKIGRAVHTSESMTYYHMLPLRLIEYNEFIKDRCAQLTIRCYNNKICRAKDITVEYNPESELTWSQQFVNNHEDWLIDCTYQNVFENKFDAIQFIHNLSLTLLGRIRFYESELSKRLSPSYYQ